jgi:hypothetical protein
MPDGMARALTVFSVPRLNLHCFYCLNSCACVICLLHLQAGSMEVMIDHMPGTPDGMARAPDGNFWFPLLAKIPPVTKVHRLLPAWRCDMFSTKNRWR